MDFAMPTRTPAQMYTCQKCYCTMPKPLIGEIHSVDSLVQKTGWHSNLVDKTCKINNS